jgi:hypothetical protein
MKVSITLTIDVDKDEWLGVGYGGGETPAEVRADIKSYVLNHVQGSTGMNESGAVVTIR